MRKWIVRVALGVLALVLLAVPGSLALVNSAWFKAELERRSGEALQAEVKLQDLSVSPFSGSAELQGATLSRRRPDGEIDLSVARAAAKVAVLPLVFRRVEIQSVQLEKPAVKAVVPLAEPVAAVGSLEKLKEAFSKQPKEPGPEWSLRELRISGGSIDATFTRASQEPIRLRLSNLDYAARDVAPDSMSRLFFGAKFSFDIAGGGRVEKDVGTLRMTSIDMPLVGRLLAPGESFRFEKGTLDLVWEGDVADVRISGLKLSGRGEFLFVSVEKLARYVDSKEGNLHLRLELGGLESSGDLDYLLAAFWNGLWESILREAAPDVKQVIEDKATEAVKGLFDKLKKKR
ncbi:MAG TPA: hypothetical protein VI643_03085 [Planctomycetota bacterium]|nr:hypothetical protein [Planctomycetota bacterium]